MATSWTSERTELLQKLWSEGLSASQIANELGGLTRNAVIGKVHRLGLSDRGKAPTQAKPRRTRQAPRRSQAARSCDPSTAGQQSATTPQNGAVDSPVEEEASIPLGQRRSILTLSEQTCKWPVGDPGGEDFYFCGAPCDPDPSMPPYCEAHAQVAYQPRANRRRERRIRTTDRPYRPKVNGLDGLKENI